MAPEQQRKTLAVLAEIWALSPEIRLGQLFTHLGFLGEAHLGRGLAYIDDDELLSILDRHRTELSARDESTVKPLESNLGDLLKGISDKNTHPETDWGDAVGREVW